MIIFKKIEIYYLANEDKNIFFTLLGDCTTSVKEVEKSDEDVINTGLQEKKRLILIIAKLYHKYLGTKLLCKHLEHIIYLNKLKATQ